MLAATDIVTTLWRTVVVLRIVTAVFAIGSIIGHHDGFARPGLGWMVLTGIAVWTVLICLAYSHDVTRRIHVITGDLLVTLALTASSVLVLSAAQLSEVTERAPLLTTVWSSGPVLAAAVHAGRIAGVLFGVAVCVVDVWARGFTGGDLTGDTPGAVVLLLGTGFMVGSAATAARRATEQARRAARTEAASAGRVQRAQSAHDTADSDDVDLAAALRSLAGSRVDVAVPATEVPLPASDVEELVAVAREVLAGAAPQVGPDPDAKAFVLVEDLGAEVVLTLHADTDGGTGVPHSIRGRVADLGATLTLGVRPGQGTEWEVRLTRATVEE